MTTQFDCTLGGVLLSSLDESISVLDIHEDAPQMRFTTAAAHSEGLHLLSNARESLTVRVRFAIHEPDIPRRREVLRAVHAWAAKGGILTTADRPGQQLTVACTALPAMSANDWTEPLTLAFTTTRIPYWEDTLLTQVSAMGEATFTAPGTADSTPVNSMVVNIGDAAITQLTLRCGDTQMIFENISLPVNGMFLMTNIDGVLAARINGQSVLKHRTADSSDALLAPCGEAVTVQASADQTVNTIFMARGRYV